MNKHTSVSNRRMWGIQLVRSNSWGGSKWLLSIGLGERVVTFSFGRNPERPNLNRQEQT